LFAIYANGNLTFGKKQGAYQVVDQIDLNEKELNGE